MLDEENEEGFLGGSASACWACAKLIEMYTARHKALVFKSQGTQERLHVLKLTQIMNWSKNDTMLIVDMYK